MAGARVEVRRCQAKLAAQARVAAVAAAKAKAEATFAAAAKANAARQAQLNACNSNPDLNVLVRSADSTTGQCFRIYAAITQFDQSTGACTFRANFDKTSHTDWFDFPDNNGIFSAADTTSCPSFDAFSQNQIVQVWAVSEGSITYDTQLGGSTTANQFTVLQITGA
jgi:hypothetical protein